MRSNFSLKEIVQKETIRLIAEYTLAIVEISDNETALRGEGYLLDFSVDRDGASLVYFDTTKSPAIGYNVFLFLMNKRRNQLNFNAAATEPKTREEFIQVQISSLCQHLQTAGKDILEGSKLWTAEYVWPTVKMSEALALIVK